MSSPSDTPWIVWESDNHCWWLSQTGCLYGPRYFQMYQLAMPTKVHLPRESKPEIWAKDVSYGDRAAMLFKWQPIPRYVAAAIVKHRPIFAEIAG